MRKSSRKLVPWLLALCLAPALGAQGLPWDAWVFESEKPFPKALEDGVAERCEGTVAELLSHLGREEPREGSERAFQRLDLNGDGRCDYLLRESDPRYCGTGGCPYGVYIAVEDGFRPLGDLFGWGFKPLEPHGGYLQLESGDYSGGELIRTLNRFNGREYDWVYSDFHRLRLEDDVWVFYKRHENRHWREATEAP